MDEKTRRKRSYAAGHLLSLAGKPLPLTASKPGSEPIAYLYNGVRLPKLPEWDREMYPYAVLDYELAKIEDKWFNKPRLRVSSKPFCIGTWNGDPESPVTVTNGNVVGKSMLVANGGTEWDEFSFSEWGGYWDNGNYIFYANHDVIYASPEFGELYNTVCVAKSDPIPVYE